MGVAYFLVCMDCKSGVHLGKAVATQYDEESQTTYGFSDIGHNSGNAWMPSASTVINISHFLMLHRGHELRVLPDSVEKYASVIGFPHGWPDSDDDLDPNHSRTIFLDTEIPRPSADEDLKNLPKNLIDKLKKF